MNYPIEIDELAGESVMLAAGLGGTKLLVGGREYKSKKGVFSVERPGAGPVQIRMKSRLIDPVPNLEVNGRKLVVAPPLAWYEYAWCCLPLALLFLGGAIGGAIGGASTFLNVGLFRAQRAAPLRYLAAGALTAGAFVTFLVVATGLALTFGAP